MKKIRIVTMLELGLSKMSSFVSIKSVLRHTQKRKRQFSLSRSSLKSFNDFSAEKSSQMNNKEKLEMSSFEEIHQLQ